MLDSEQNLNGIKNYLISLHSLLYKVKKKKKIHGVHRKRRGLGIGAFTLKDSRRKSCCYRNKLPDRRRESHAANKLTGQQQL